MNSSLNQVVSLLEFSPPPFIFLNDPIAPKFTLQNLLPALKSNTRLVHVDSISCFGPRLLYDTILNGLAQHTPSWDDGCKNWSQDIANDSFDSFLHALKALHTSLSENGSKHLRLIVVIEKPERLRERMPDVIVPLTRLAELVCIVKSMYKKGAHLFLD